MQALDPSARREARWRGWLPRPCCFQLLSDLPVLSVHLRSPMQYRIYTEANGRRRNSDRREGCRKSNRKYSKNALAWMNDPSILWCGLSCFERRRSPLANDSSNTCRAQYRVSEDIGLPESHNSPSRPSKRVCLSLVSRDVVRNFGHPIPSVGSPLSWAEAFSRSSRAKNRHHRRWPLDCLETQNRSPRKPAEVDSVAEPKRS